jgi:hypothetical protein
MCADSEQIVTQDFRPNPAGSQEEHVQNARSKDTSQTRPRSPEKATGPGAGEAEGKCRQSVPLTSQLTDRNLLFARRMYSAPRG